MTAPAHPSPPPQPAGGGDSITASSLIAGKTNAHEFDPEQYRMSLGDHLEELRRRIILGLLGFAVVAGVMLIFGDQVMLIFCRPLFKALQRQNLNSQIYYTQLAEGFVVWFRICLLSAAALASPWIIYQLWQFVAAGLYPKERKYITQYAPLSVALMIIGMAFVYFLVLPVTINFFLEFSGSVPVPQSRETSTEAHVPTTVPALAGDPAHPQPYEMWFDRDLNQLKIFADGEIRVLPIGPSRLLAPHIGLSDYISLVTTLLITFALGFQLPLVVLALNRIGILDLKTLRGLRRYVYVVMAFLAAVMTGGDVVTAQIALTIPLCLLFELGVYLSRRSDAAAAAE
jgi:sec-independent protein translocase protein TatC